MEEKLAAAGYEQCDNDEEWVLCTYCGKKVFAGTNKTDLARHEVSCPKR
jgi:hypothetical protein